MILLESNPFLNMSCKISIMLRISSLLGGFFKDIPGPNRLDPLEWLYALKKAHFDGSGGSPT